MGTEKIVGGPVGRIAGEAAEAIGQQVGKDAVKSTAGATIHGVEGAAGDAAGVAAAAAGGVAKAGGGAGSIARNTKDLIGAGHPTAPPSAPPAPPGAPIGAMSSPGGGAAGVKLVPAARIAIDAARRELETAIMGETFSIGRTAAQVADPSKRDGRAIWLAAKELGYLDGLVPEDVAARIRALPRRESPSEAHADRLAVYRDALFQKSEEIRQSPTYQELLSQNGMAR